MSTILKSLHGHQLGLDKDGYLTSPIGAKIPALYLGTSGSETQSDIEGLTTVSAASTGSNISPRGTTTLGATSGNNPTYNLSAPVAGVVKRIFASGTSTGQIISSTGESANFASTGGSTHVSATVPKGASLILIGLSTSLYGVQANQGTVVFA
jgi:hypothetical protein